MDCLFDGYLVYVFCSFSCAYLSKFYSRKDLVASKFDGATLFYVTDGLVLHPLGIVFLQLL